MNTDELLEVLQRLAAEEDRPRAVVVKTENGGLAAPYLEEIASASRGFDWTAGRLILSTTRPLVVARRLNENLSVIACKRLAYLQGVYSKGGRQYVTQGGERDWLAGFREGVRQHITWCDRAEAEHPVDRRRGRSRRGRKKR